MIGQPRKDFLRVDLGTAGTSVGSPGTELEFAL